MSTPARTLEIEIERDEQDVCLTVKGAGLPELATRITRRGALTLASILTTAGRAPNADDVVLHCLLTRRDEP